MAENSTESAQLAAYPTLAARTKRFTCGAPRAVTVAEDGSRVIFLRSSGPTDPVDALWVLDTSTGTERVVADPATLLAAADADDLPESERALRERLRLTASGIGSYATDPAGRVAAFTLSGRLFRADLIDGGCAELPTDGGVIDPRPDPTGQRIAYVADGNLHVITGDGPAEMIAGEADSSSGVTWGLAEFIAAEEFDRFRGYWWSPDGSRILAARVDDSRVPRWHLHDPAHPERPAREVAYPHAGADNASVTLHLLDLDGGWVDVHWDTETYPYLIAVSWGLTGGPLLTVMRRPQHHGLVLSVDARTGETQVHAELADSRFAELVPGTPAQLPDGRVLLGGDLTHDTMDARCLFADGSMLTPPSLYVRAVSGRIGRGGATALLVAASDGEPEEQHLYRVRTSATSPTAGHPERLTDAPGWHVGHAGGDTLVVGSLSLDHPGVRWTVRTPHRTFDIANHAAEPPYAPRPALGRVTDRRLPAAVLYPTSHVAGRKLPVLVDIYGGPHHQEVMAARFRWLAKQWWADAGPFAVVTIDNRGTPGVSPSFEKSIHRRMADLILADQIEGLAALAEKHPDLDLDRVAIRGWSFGGWLAALAVMRRPDIYHAAIAGAPVTDWALYDTAYTERYLGLPADNPEVYARHSLVSPDSLGALEGPARPLMLIHGMVDDNVVAAHTLRLSAALLTAGHPHLVLPLPGATHMAAGGLAERLLTAELDFLRSALPPH